MESWFDPLPTLAPEFYSRYTYLAGCAGGAIGTAVKRRIFHVPPSRTSDIRIGEFHLSGQGPNGPTKLVARAQRQRLGIAVAKLDRAFSARGDRPSLAARMRRC